MTTQQTIQPHARQQTGPSRRRRWRGWWSLLDAGEPFAPAVGEPEAWARLAHAHQRPPRRWSETDDGRPAAPTAPAAPTGPPLAARPLFARYPLLGAGRP